MNGLYAGIMVENHIAVCVRCNRAVCECFLFTREEEGEDNEEECKDGQD